jgi:hypothetical protein
MECPGFAGLVAIDEDTLFDCNDSNPAINPGQLEICDEVDNNCNMEIDDDTQIVAWYSDNDGDGFGSAASGVVMSCEPIVGASVLGTDCDDDNPAVHPAAAETCDGTDQDCNGRADFEISMGNFEDDDGDGSADIVCGEPLGVDCNDLDPNTATGTAESCDGRDNDCDDVIDEEVSDFVWYYDGDRDGYGSDSTVRFPPIVSCSAPLGYVGSSADCDDGDAGRSPAATEDCNSLDDDCDAIDEGAFTCECPIGIMDCDEDALRVCETRTDSDPENCGGCGISCGGNDCIAGVCEVNRCSVTSVFNGFVTYARVECTDGSYAPICADETTDTDEDGFSDCNDNLCINGFIAAGLPQQSVNCETEGGVVSCCGPAYIAAVCPDATDWRDCNCFNCANSR